MTGSLLGDLARGAVNGRLQNTSARAPVRRDRAGDSIAPVYQSAWVMMPNHGYDALARESKLLDNPDRRNDIATGHRFLSHHIQLNRRSPFRHWARCHHRGDRTVPCAGKAIPLTNGPRRPNALSCVARPGCVGGAAVAAAPVHAARCPDSPIPLSFMPHVPGIDNGCRRSLSALPGCRCARPSRQGHPPVIEGTGGLICHLPLRWDRGHRQSWDQRSS